MLVVVGWGEVLVPEVLVEAEDEAKVDEGENQTHDHKVKERLDEETEHIPIQNSKKFTEANLNLKKLMDQTFLMWASARC